MPESGYNITKHMKQMALNLKEFEWIIQILANTPHTPKSMPFSSVLLVNAFQLCAASCAGS